MVFPPQITLPIIRCIRCIDYNHDANFILAEFCLKNKNKNNTALWRQLES